MKQDYPFAICVGAAKAGTTTLHALMSRHPDVCVTNIKETDFFADDERAGRGRDFYLNTYYPSRRDGQMLFEADPIYMYARGCMERIQRDWPQARVIVMLRNPIDRAFSQYLYRMSYARYDESFEEMCAREPERMQQGDADRLEYGCLDRSRYSAQIREILRYFPRERLYFIVFETFIRAQQAEFDRLAQWLAMSPAQVGSAKENEGGRTRSVWIAKLLYDPRMRALRKQLGRFFPTNAARRIYGMIGDWNKAPYGEREKPKLSADLRRRLLSQFEPEIAEVEKLTGLDLTLWRSNDR